MTDQVRPEQVKDGYRSLPCTACDAGNRLPEDVVEGGWFRCRHCGTAATIAGAGAIVIEGPRGEVLRIVRPGSSEFLVSPGEVLPPHWAIALVVVAGLVLSGVASLLRAHVPATATWGVPASLGLVVLLACLVLWTCAARQRLELVDGRADVWWTSFGVTWRHQRVTFDRVRTCSRVVGRRGVTLQASGCRLFLAVASADALRWLGRELTAAIKGVRAAGGEEEVLCPGCGGPVGTERELRDAHGLECPHCTTGLVQTVRGLALPPVRIKQDLRELPGSEGDGTPRSVGTALEWRIPSFGRLNPWGSLLALLIWLGVIGGVVAMAWHLVERLPVLQAVWVFVALALTVGGAWGTWHFVALYYSWHVMRLDDRLFSHETTLAGWRHDRRRALLSRVLSLEASSAQVRHEGRDVHGPRHAKLTVNTATDELVVELWWQRAAVRSVLKELADRIEALGREIHRVEEDA